MAIIVVIFSLLLDESQKVKLKELLFGVEISKLKTVNFKSFESGFISLLSDITTSEEDEISDNNIKCDNKENTNISINQGWNL